MSTSPISTWCCPTTPPVSTTARTTSPRKPRPHGKPPSAGTTSTQSRGSPRFERSEPQRIERPHRQDRLLHSRRLRAVAGVGWDARLGRKAARMVRRWPASSVVVTDELELRPLIADDVGPFLRSIDRDVRFWQGFDEQYVTTYAAVLKAATRSTEAVLPWRFLAVVRS